jgi:hypothetical protein
MYLKDSNIKHLLGAFFGLGIGYEASVIMGLQMPIISLIYSIGLFILIFNFNKLKEKKYLWEPALGIIGIFAIIYFFFYLIGFKAWFFEKVSSFVSLLVWARCINYLGEDKDNEDQDDSNNNGQIINTNGSI